MFVFIIIKQNFPAPHSVSPVSESKQSSAFAMFAHERKVRKQRLEIGCCPVCGVTLRSGDIDNHLVQELEKLSRLPQSRPLSQRTPLPMTAHADFSLPSTSSFPEASTSNSLPQLKKLRRKGSSWIKYESIRASRLSRARQKQRPGENGVTFEDSAMERECPVCDKPFPVNELQLHTQRCLRQAETEFEDDEVDIEGGDDREGVLEEYEWCGMTRVRATTLLRAEGQLHAIGTMVMRGSEDEMVDVCDDEDNAFGPSQYTDEDIVSCSNTNIIRDKEVYKREQHSDADPIHGSSSSSPSDGQYEAHSISTTFPVEYDFENSSYLNLAPSSSPCATSSDPGGIATEALSLSASLAGTSGSQSGSGPPENRIARTKEYIGDSSSVIEALRARVKELEQERQKGRVTCRVCHGEYETPVVSVSCWHVHCETCWMQALAVKKLCPQCNAITTASDLRRIYL